jgi:phosphoribosylanthranilate isomerase
MENQSQISNLKSPIKLKVCGLTKLDQIVEFVQMNIDFLGFIFYEKSPRYVLNALTLNEIKSIQHRGKVGVFVNENIPTILEISEKAGLNYIQLHGDETDFFISELKEKLNQKIKIIKVFRIPIVIPRNEESQRFFTSLLAVQNDIDYVLFDTDSKSFGGTGKTFDWQILNELEINIPYFLSGGISAENIENIKQLELQPFALDINSKVEIEPGNKNINKIKIVKNLLH